MIGRDLNDFDAGGRFFCDDRVFVSRKLGREGQRQFATFDFAD